MKIIPLSLCLLPILALGQSLDKEYVRMNGRVIVVRRPNQPITVNVTPANQSINVGLTVQFAATVNNATNPAANWTLSPNLGVINATGLYTASTPVAVNTNITVTATSVQDPTKSHSVTLTVMPAIAVSVSPGSQTLQAGASPYQFAAFVANNVNQSVLWSIDSGGVGTVTASGLYSPPAAGSGSAVLRATSTVDPTKSGIASISITGPGGGPTMTLTEQPPPGTFLGGAYYTIVADGGSSPVNYIHFHLSDGSYTEYCAFNFAASGPEPYVTGPANNTFVGHKITSYGHQPYDSYYPNDQSGFTALGVGFATGFGRAAHTNHCQIQWGYYTTAGNTVTLRFLLVANGNWPGASAKTMWGWLINANSESPGSSIPLTVVNVSNGLTAGSRDFNPKNDWAPWWTSRTFTFSTGVGSPADGFQKSIWWINPNDGPMQATNGCLIQYNHQTSQISIGDSFAITYAVFPVGPTPIDLGVLYTPSCNVHTANTWVATTPNGGGKYINITLAFYTPDVNRTVYTTWVTNYGALGVWLNYGFWGTRSN